MTTLDYFSDRTRGPRPRTEDEVDDDLWAAVLALLERGIESGVFARDFPIRCEDGKGIYACDRDGLMATIRAEIPELGWPLPTHSMPPTLAVLDLLEFMQRHACGATDGSYHSFFDHHHLRFDRDEGYWEFRDTINRLLARSGTVYELNESGHIERLVPAAVAADLRRELPQTRDRQFDKLLDTAARKYLDPDADVRQEALEKLWDAFERAKTMLHSNKKSGVARAGRGGNEGSIARGGGIARSRDEDPNGHRESVPHPPLRDQGDSTERCFRQPTLLSDVRMSATGASGAPLSEPEQVRWVVAKRRLYDEALKVDSDARAIRVSSRGLRLDVFQSQGDPYAGSRSPPVAYRGDTVSRARSRPRQAAARRRTCSCAGYTPRRRSALN